MTLAYATYQRNSLKQPPEACFVGQWRVEYLAFSEEANRYKTPLIVIGGAFQNFNSYKFCVEKILHDLPVILVDMPSLGNNAQLAPELGMEDLADLLYEFVVVNNIPKVSLMGLSLGSVVASTFAWKYPDRIERLVVTGILPRPRKSWRMLLEESLAVLNEGRMDEFGQAVVLYLINHCRLEETQITDITRRLFHRQMQHFTENEQARYRINAHRLLAVEGILGYPSCPTLVATGEYDSFTLPYENAQFASRCPNVTFALIERADHVAQLERLQESLEMFATFLRGEAINAIPGIRVYDKSEIGSLERRGVPRYEPVNGDANVVGESHVARARRIDIPAKVIDISFFGCMIELQKPLSSLAEHARDLKLHLESPALSLDLLVFEHDGRILRCLFKHGNIKRAEEFSGLLKREEFFTLKEDSRCIDDGKVIRL